MDIDFTDGEIREELARLGYKDVPEDKLVEFKKDLMRLIHSEKSKNNSLDSSIERPKSAANTYSPDAPREGSEFVAGNFSNHGNQWLRNQYKEDWHYQGEESLQTKKESGSHHAVSRSNVSVVADEKDCRFDRHSQCSDICSDSETDGGTKFVKRKISRKGTNGQRVVDESFSTSDSIDHSGLYDVYEKVKRLAMRDCECGKTRPTSADTEPPYRIKGINRNPSVLMARKDPPHTRNLNKTKPFQRHQMYLKAWKMQPPIGEDFRHNVCREVHSKLLKKDEVKPSHKMFVPNTYVVPSEKPRYDLRWAVRKCNQNYEMPPCGFFHEV
ncbi:unnamed protein product [Candidula unifasciata]|uniref:Centriolar and ciliogenesis-associated protein HYLS1 C-terminal domain-containing protein n=1 Tax=Candidula unifasciata TaxID=100452 RepID=A0A8S3ZYY7_9EUPU|nr:unnamed protein product [Candidula unifasciata]